MIKYLKLAALGAVVAAAGFSANDAQAQSASYSCTNSTYGASYATYSSSCTGTGSQASTLSTATAVLATAATTSAKLVSGRVSSAVGGAGGFKVASNGFDASTGASAGGMGGKVGTWASGSWSDVEDENVSTAFDGDVFSVMGGVDYRIMPKVVVGLAFGYEDLDIDTGFNSGSLEGTGYTIAPYIGGEIAPDVTASLTAGYSEIEYDTTRVDPIALTTFAGSTDAERFFVDATVAGSHMIDPVWHLRGKLSVFYATEDKDAYNEVESTGAINAIAAADNDFGQASLEAKLGYVFDMVEPYALAGVAYDFAKDEAAVAVGQSASSLDDEDFGAKFGAGIDFDLGHSVTAGIEGYTVQFRDDYNEYTVSGGLRVEF